MSKQKHFPLIILGSGPAGCTAAIYAARANIKALLIAGLEFGGQLTRTNIVDNWPGDEKGVLGGDLMNRMTKHVERFGVEMSIDQITEVNFQTKPFWLKGDQEYTADAVIIATGASPRLLGVEAEKKLLGKGISTCATCDGFFYKNKNIAVVGGGNTALDDTLYLAEIVDHITLIHRRDRFAADPFLVEQLEKKVKEQKISLELNSTISSFLETPEGKLRGLILENASTKKPKEILVSGLFVAIGHDPNSKIFSGQLLLENNYLVIGKNPAYGFTATNIPGIFACGDVTNFYHQAVIAAGFGAMAALDSKKWLSKKI
jgi:thioredoxin reductase (NADPH)